MVAQAGGQGVIVHAAMRPIGMHVSEQPKLLYGHNAVALHPALGIPHEPPLRLPVRDHASGAPGHIEAAAGERSQVFRPFWIQRPRLAINKFSGSTKSVINAGSVAILGVADDAPAWAAMAHCAAVERARRRW